MYVINRLSREFRKYLVIGLKNKLFNGSGNIKEY